MMDEKNMYHVYSTCTNMVNVLKLRTLKFLTKMAYANSVDPGQTAPEGAV